MRLNKQKFLSMLGLAKRAGAIIAGTDLVTKALPSGKIRSVIYASDASLNTKKRITDKCAYYNVKCICVDASVNELGHAIGRVAPSSVIGITNDNFSKQITTLSGGNVYGKN